MRFDPSNRFKFIGHNLINFDLPFIRKRAVINGIKPPAWFPVNPRPNSEFVYDTMIEWAGWNGRISLDRLGRALQVGDKGNFDGSMVYDAVLVGDIKRVADYCVDDVDLTRAIYKRMTFS
jgi:DNA polymerase III epsilon subunit-like protein